MARGGCKQKKFHIQKGDGGQSGSQDLMKTADLSGKTYISSISDPKGTAFRGTQVRIQFSCTFETPYFYILLFTNKMYTFFQENFEFDVGMLAALAVGFRIMAFLMLLLKTYRAK